MATFTNFATLSYNGGTLNSNTVTGEILETLSATKTAVVDSYSVNDSVTYVISLVNSGNVPLSGLTVSDDLGGYAFDTTTVYPLNYVENSIRYYVNGVLQVAPATTAGPPFVITGINVPANSNAIIIYETNVTGFAPLDADSTIVNTASVTGDDLSSAVEATETVTVVDGFDLAISKAINPAVISENGQLTYTFVIENYGNAEAVSTDDIVLTDTFDPVLNSIAVAYNGTAWVEGINYTYDETTGLFTSERGQITVPAATYTQNPDGTFSVTPGTAVITITGTI